MVQHFLDRNQDTRNINFDGMTNYLNQMHKSLTNIWYILNAITFVCDHSS